MKKGRNDRKNLSLAEKSYLLIYGSRMSPPFGHEFWQSNHFRASAKERNTFASIPIASDPAEPIRIIPYGKSFGPTIAIRLLKRSPCDATKRAIVLISSEDLL